MSESRRRLAFALVNEQISANSEASGQWARQGSNLRPTTYEKLGSFDWISGLSCGSSRVGRGPQGADRRLIAALGEGWC
jgi:hypothetical protein